MKLSKILLISLMGIFAAGGVASTYSVTRQGTTNTGNSAKFDSALLVQWGKGSNKSSSLTITDVSNLAVGEPQYRALSVSYASTSSVAKKIELSLSLAATTGNYHINGLTITAYKVTSDDSNFDSASTDSDYSTIVGSYATQIAEVSSSTTSASGTLIEDTSANATSSSGGSGSVDVVLKFVYDGSYDSTNPSYTMSGALTLSQTISAIATSSSSN